MSAAILRKYRCDLVPEWRQPELTKLLALADDLSGALEVGAKLAAQGISTAVTTSPEVSVARTDALVIDTETRHLNRGEAERKVFHLVRAGRNADIPFLYKKTDSTLRGNIAAELSGIAAVYPLSPVAYIPAYPQMGRTVREGRLYVFGVPVEETEFARDPRNPVSTGNIHEMLAESRNLPNVTVYDAETDEQVVTAVQSVGPLLCGPACLVDHLGDKLRLPKSEPPALPAIQSCLAVNGTVHEVSRRQMEYAEAHGWSYSEPPWMLLKGENAAPSGAAVRDLIDKTGIDAVAIFGGDMAYAVTEAFGQMVLTPLGEVVEGVSVSLLGKLVFITKAGGFGPVDVLNQIRDRLSRNN